MKKEFFQTVGIVFVLIILFGIHQKFFIEQLEFAFTESELLIDVEVARTAQDRKVGLSGRDEIGEVEGVLFIFDYPDYYSFWMKDMNFEIDIIWIDKNKKIVDLSKNISPETWPNYFQPEREVKYVLEVTGGFVKSNEIKVGERVSF